MLPLHVLSADDLQTLRELFPPVKDECWIEYLTRANIAGVITFVEATDTYTHFGHYAGARYVDKDGFKPEFFNEAVSHNFQTH